MSEVVDVVEASFKALVLENRTYRSITVKEICEGAFISRRTFYANFIDKRAVLAEIFRNDCVRPVRRLLEILSVDEASKLAPEVIGRFYQGIYDNGEFYSSLVKPMRHVDTTFSRVVVRAVSKMLYDGVAGYNPDADKKLLDYTSEYHANAVALILEKWIYESFETPLETMAKNQATILVPSMTSLLENHFARSQSIGYGQSDFGWR